MLSRARWLRIHRALGLGIAAFLLIQALTGALLLYAGPVARMIDPAGMTSRAEGPPISAGEAIERADRAMPGYRVVRVFAPDGDRATWFAHLRDDQGRTAYASIDPAGGAVRRAGGLFRFPVEAALQIHYGLTMGRAGMLVVALNGLALLTMAATGLAYWWPKRKLAKALAIRWALAPRLVLRQAHRTLGVVAAAFLIILASTGLLLAIPNIAAGGGSPAPLAAVAAGAVDRSVARAQGVFPGSQLNDARINGERLIVSFRAPERNARAVHSVVVTVGGAHIVGATAADRSTALWMTVLPIHAGNVIDPIGPALLLLVALTLASLAVTGPIMWWQAEGQRRRSVRKVSQ